MEIWNVGEAVARVALVEVRGVLAQDAVLVFVGPAGARAVFPLSLGNREHLQHVVIWGLGIHIHVLHHREAADDLGTLVAVVIHAVVEPALLTFAWRECLVAGKGPHNRKLAALPVTDGVGSSAGCAAAETGRVRDIDVDGGEDAERRGCMGLSDDGESQARGNRKNSLPLHGERGSEIGIELGST